MTTDLREKIRELFAEEMQKFAGFCEQEWTLTDQDKADFDAKIWEDFRDGYNTALTDGLTGAITYWLDEANHDD